jgi:hypothetical protein
MLLGVAGTEGCSVRQGSPASRLVREPHASSNEQNAAAAKRLGATTAARLVGGSKRVWDLTRCELRQVGSGDMEDV